MFYILIQTAYSLYVIRVTKTVIFLSCQITDEIAKDVVGHHITEFISKGPKSYSYSVTDGTTKVKIKGFPLNYKNSMKLDMESMKSMVSDMDKRIKIKENKISRERVSRKIVNREEEKTYQLVYDNGTIPFGFTWIPMEEDKSNVHNNAMQIDCSHPLYSRHYDNKENKIGELFPYPLETSEQSDIDIM